MKISSRLLCSRFLVLALFLTSSAAWANSSFNLFYSQINSQFEAVESIPDLNGEVEKVPLCFDGNMSIQVDNNKVIRWKQSTDNQFQARAHIRGVLTKIYPDRSGHNHFKIKIGTNPEDTLEVVYNQDFGPLRSVVLGAMIQACGDYITSNGATDRYPASPDGAIIHWVHRSDSAKHASGFVIINGMLFGHSPGSQLLY